MRKNDGKEKLSTGYEGTKGVERRKHHRNIRNMGKSIIRNEIQEMEYRDTFDQQIIETISLEPKPRVKNVAEIIKHNWLCKYWQKVTDWELDFIWGVRGKDKVLTSLQLIKLDEIYVKYRKYLHKRK